MTTEEKAATLLLAKTAERLFHENTCLKAMLKSFGERPEHLPDWENWLERMMNDEELRKPVRQSFVRIYAQIEQSADPSEALKALLRDFPISGKGN